MKTLNDQRDGRAPDSKHDREKFVRQLQFGRADSIARASAATTTTTTATTAATTTTPSRDTIPSSMSPTTSSQSYDMSSRGGWYVGLAGGAAVPTGTISDFYKSGFDVNVPIGWQSQNSILGFRIDLGYSRFNGREAGTSGLTSQPDDPSIWSGAARWGSSES